METQVRTELGVKILVVLLAPVILYWEDLSIVAGEALKSDISTHILAIPFLLAYILYRIRRVFSASTSQTSTFTILSRAILLKDMVGFLLCLLAYLIKWYGSYTFQPLEYHVASLPIFVAGIIILVFNFKTLRSLLFPVAFLLFLTPPPVKFVQIVGSTLAAFSAQAAYLLLKTLGLPLDFSYNYGSPVILLKPPSGDSIPFAIDISCSGLYSLIGFTIFALFTAYIARGSFKKKILTLSLGFPLIYTLNILRIILLVLIGYYSGPDLALNTFHLLGGWTLILLGTILLLTIAEKITKIQIFRETPETCTHSHMIEEDFCMDCGKILETQAASLSKMEIVKLTLILVTTVSLIFIQVPVFALTEGPAEISIQSPTWPEKTTEILPELEEYNLRFVYRDRRFENISDQDASLIYLYTPENSSKHHIWVGLEIGPAKGIIHPWEICLITFPQIHGTEPSITQLDLRDIHLLDNPPISARYFAFQGKNSNETQVILYWYTKSIFKTGEGYEEKWSRISLIEYTQNPKEYTKAEDELLPIAENIANYWRPISTWSGVSLTIAKNGLTLVTTAYVLLLGILIFFLYLEMGKRRKARQLYTQISNIEDRQILEAVKSIKKRPVNGLKIASKYREMTGKNIEVDTLYRKLVEAEEAGLLNRRIINKEDKPYILWEAIF